MKKIFTIVSALFLLLSCAEEQDFDQIDDLSVTPNLATSIFYFESDEATINLAGTGVFYEESFTFEAFKEPFVAERVLEGEITYQITNTTSKDLDLSITFLDAEENVLDQERFAVPETPSPLVERKVAYGENGKSLDILRNTATISVFGENLSDAISTSSQRNPKIILRSSAAFRLRLQ